ncbi:MAG: hypothetical protein KKF62_13960 [Bacteroidetes bacterium]|nr:hypothetical protein [Bacteroidota bacterium]MBU1115269.1 hypothetical protein [Bacteroidota bacterium]MBU1798598.1 hypothetical protein [Bacteroidota bacterium]
MTKILNKNIKTFHKTESISLVAIYVFLLLITSFHFHPVDFGNSKSLLNKAPVEKSEHSYTAKDCPILNFAQNGFNSTNFITNATKVDLETTQLIFPTTNFYFEKNFSYSFHLRGPPSL